MKIFLPELEIGPIEGFDPSKDIFKRAELGRGLTNLLSLADDPLVIAVDGQWGSGKTVFLKMWSGELRKLGFPVIYFDAFAHDYFEDAFLAIAGEIVALADEKSAVSDGKLKTFKSVAVKTGKILARATLKIGIRAGTFGAGKAEDFEGLADAVADDAASLFDEHIGEMITKQKQHKSTLAAFKDSLSSLPKLLAPISEEERSAIAAKPLIFIIDELDRCRPDFALQILERMKHFFAVPNVHFVLGTNLKQLSNSIATCYGPNIDADLYLQKFVHLVFHLQDKREHHSTATIETYVNYLEKLHNFSSPDQQFTSQCATELKRIATETNLTLRTIQRVFSIIAIATASTPHNHWRNPAIITGLAVIKVVKSTLFERAKLGLLRFSEVSSVLGFVDEDQLEKFDPAQWSIQWWRFVSDPAAPDNLVQSLSESLFKYSFHDRLSMLPHAANNIIDRFDSRI